MIALRRTRGTAIRPRRAIHVDVNVNVNLYPNSVLRSHGRPAPDARLVPSTGRRYVSGGVTSLRIWTGGGGRLFLRHLLLRWTGQPLLRFCWTTDDSSIDPSHLLTNSLRLLVLCRKKKD